MEVFFFLDAGEDDVIEGLGEVVVLLCMCFFGFLWVDICE